MLTVADVRALVSAAPPVAVVLCWLLVADGAAASDVEAALVCAPAAEAGVCGAVGATGADGAGLLAAAAAAAAVALAGEVGAAGFVDPAADPVAGPAAATVVAEASVASAAGGVGVAAGGVGVGTSAAATAAAVAEASTVALEAAGAESAPWSLSLLAGAGVPPAAFGAPLAWDPWAGVPLDAPPADWALDDGVFAAWAFVDWRADD